MISGLLFLVTDHTKKDKVIQAIWKIIRRN